MFFTVVAVTDVTRKEEIRSQAAGQCASLQSIINSAAAGSTVVVPACVYRESVTVGKSLTLDGQDQAEIRGSDMWTGWTKSGAVWVSTLTVPTFSTITGHCQSGTDLACIRAEQVFINGAYIKQIADNSIPGTGQFSMNSSRHVVIADDPTGKTVEVTMRRHWIQVTAPNVVIKNFTMKHAATDAQDGALSVKNVGNVIIQNNNLSYAHGGNLTLQFSPNSKVTANDISYGGELGIHGNRDDGLIIQSNRIHHNNFVLYSCGWECGGIKISHMTNSIVQNNQVYANDGKGIWCDIDCDGNLYNGNRIWDNSDQGIVYEISGNAKITHNAVWQNGYGSENWGWGGGILVQNSHNVEVFENTLAWNADGTGIIAQDRGTHNNVSANSIHDNVIAQDVGYALYLLSDTSAANTSGNTNANNKVFITYTASIPWGTPTKLTKAAMDTLLTQACLPLLKNGPLSCSVSPAPTAVSTIIPTAPVATAIPTAIVSAVPTGIPTQPSGSQLALTIFLHGIGKGGDNVNPTAIGTTPMNPNRTFTIQMYNSTNQLAVTKQGLLTYNSAAGNFQGTVDIGQVASGVFTVKLSVPRYLNKSVPGIITITGSQTTINIPAVALVAGDINLDNALSIIDYNLILDCFSDLAPAKNCSQAGKQQASDLNDDGNVNQFDYNLFLRELSVQGGA
jgi:hypothetical protein